MKAYFRKQFFIDVLLSFVIAALLFLYIIHVIHG